ncbi:DUF5134 domain-containing protein [Amycolatopsis echigonensis]|uniref:DUF5134 domain-containing protein n=1 Tax=Amycolatopsis echigonensis TaxID=2576905 RepID=A0A8E1W7V0_9PSEU|nr:DUF5134 domain-containing protein [Amycolatopsis echigonensis]MBB2505721.1 DUF5134 domain-containing protein [Amycolatopsis echigonensis]
MSGPAWLSGIFVALMTATSLFYAGRILLARILRRRTEFDVDLTHAAMGATMAVMLGGALSPGTAGILAVGAAVPTLWFAWRSVRRYVLADALAARHNAQQAVTPGAMLYMLVGIAVIGSASATHPSMPGMAGHGQTGSLAVDSLRLFAPMLAIPMLAVVVFTARRLRQQGTVPPTATSPETGVLAPALAVGCQLAMSVTTTYSLIVMT